MSLKSHWSSVNRTNKLSINDLEQAAPTSRAHLQPPLHLVCTLTTDTTLTAYLPLEHLLRTHADYETNLAPPGLLREVPMAKTALTTGRLVKVVQLVQLDLKSRGSGKLLRGAGADSGHKQRRKTSLHSAGLISVN